MHLFSPGCAKFGLPNIPAVARRRRGRLQADVSDPCERRPISIDHLGFPRMIETDHPKIAREVADEYSPTLPV